MLKLFHLSHLSCQDFKPFTQQPLRAMQMLWRSWWNMEQIPTRAMDLPEIRHCSLASKGNGLELDDFD